MLGGRYTRVRVLVEMSVCLGPLQDVNISLLTLSVYL